VGFEYTEKFNLLQLVIESIEKGLSVAAGVTSKDSISAQLKPHGIGLIDRLARISLI
jgi:hypothetical protein